MTARAANPSKALRVAGATAFVLFVAAFVTVAMMLDVFAAGRAFLFELLFASIFGLPALAIAMLYRRRWMSIVCAAAWAAVILLLLTPWHPRKRFVGDLYSVTPGMTVDEVERVMGRYMTGAGKKWAVPTGPAPVVVGPGETRPDDEEIKARVEAAQAAYEDPRYPVGEERAHLTGTMTYRWCDDDWAYDSDWGMVKFTDGRVVSVEFMPD